MDGRVSADSQRASVARRAAELEAAIAALQGSFPAHSVPPSLVIRLEELEDELADVRAILARGPG